MSAELADEIERRCAALVRQIAVDEMDGTRRYIREAELAAPIGFLVSDNLATILAALRRPEPDAAAVERVAKALYEDSNHFAPNLVTDVALAPWADLRPHIRAFWLGKARAALAAAQVG